MGSSARDIRAGRAYVEVGVNDLVAAGLAKARGSLLAFASGVSQIGRSLSVLGGAATAGIGLALKAFGDQDDLIGLAAQTGMTVESLSKMKYALSLVNVDLDQFLMAVRHSQRIIADSLANPVGVAGTMLTKLGLTFRQLQAMSPEQQFEALGEQLSKIPDPLFRAQLALELFGRGGTRLLPLFREGAKGLEALMEAARELGLEITRIEALASLEFTQALKTLAFTATRAAAVLGDALTPTILQLASGLAVALAQVDKFVQANKEIVTTAAIVSTSVLAIGSAMLALGFSINLAIGTLGAFSKIIKGLGGMGGAGLDILLVIPKMIGAAFTNLAILLSNTVTAVLPVLAAAFSNLGIVAVGAVFGTVVALEKLVITLGFSAYDAVIRFGRASLEVFSAVSKAIRQVAISVYDMVGVVVRTLPSIIYTIGSGVARGIVGAVQAAAVTVPRILSGMWTASSIFAGIMGKIILELFKNLKDDLVLIGQTASSLFAGLSVFVGILGKALVETLGWAYNVASAFAGPVVAAASAAAGALRQLFVGVIGSAFQIVQSVLVGAIDTFIGVGRALAAIAGALLDVAAAAVKAAFSLASVTFAAIYNTVAALLPAIGAMASALVSMTGGLITVLGPLALLGGGLYLLDRNWASVVGGFKSGASIIKASVLGIANAIIPVFNGIKSALAVGDLSLAWDIGWKAMEITARIVISKVGNALLDLPAMFAAAVGAIGQYVGPILSALSPIWEVIRNRLEILWNEVPYLIQDKLSSAFYVFEKVAIAVINRIIVAINGMIRSFNLTVSTSWLGSKVFGSGVPTIPLVTGSASKAQIQDTIREAMEAASAAVGNGASSFFKKLGDLKAELIAAGNPAFQKLVRDIETLRLSIGKKLSNAGPDAFDQTELERLLKRAKALEKEYEKKRGLRLGVQPGREDLGDTDYLGGSKFSSVGTFNAFGVRGLAGGASIQRLVTASESATAYLKDIKAWNLKSGKGLTFS